MCSLTIYDLQDLPIIDLDPTNRNGPSLVQLRNVRHYCTHPDAAKGISAP